MKYIYNILITVLALIMLNAGCDKNIDLPQVTTDEISNIKNDSAQSGGNVLSSGGSYVFSRGVVWDISENPTTNRNLGMTHDGEGYGTFVSYIFGLESDITYYVRAYATNKKGTAYGEQKEFSIIADLRDKFTGTWRLNESEVKNTMKFYNILITKDPGNRSLVLIRNFANQGSVHSAYGIVTPNRITLPAQTIASVYVSGTGILTSNNRMNWTYSVNDGADLINYTAVAEKQ